MTISFIILGGLFIIVVVISIDYFASKRRYEETLVECKRKEAQISYLIETGQILSSVLNKDRLLRLIVEVFGELSKTDRNPSISFLYLMDYNTNTYVYETGFNVDVTMLESSQLLPEDNFIKVVRKEKSILYFDDINKMPYKFFKKEKISYLGEASFFISIPLFVESEMMGFVNIFCDKDSFGYLQKEEKMLLALAAEASIALGSAVQSELAVLDRLTKIYNHAYFEARLAQEIARSDRYKYPVSLLMIDIDHFKSINDTYGHQVGDIVLKQIAQIIKRNTRIVDLCARYGGEEFAVILPETSLGEAGREKLDPLGAGGALLKAEQIRKAISEFKFSVSGKPFTVNASIGIGIKSFPGGENILKEELIKFADKALYRAKQEGRNRVTY